MKRDVAAATATSMQPSSGILPNPPGRSRANQGRFQSPLGGDAAIGHPIGGSIRADAEKIFFVACFGAAECRAAEQERAVAATGPPRPV